jgi:fido (protein-threonine AMPylation protein)
LLDTEVVMIRRLFPGFDEFRDDEGALFYRSRVGRFQAPEDTATEIVGRLSRVVFGVIEQAGISPLKMRADNLLRWHKGIFMTTFPHQAGQIRTGESQFGVQWREQGALHKAMVRGSDPRLILPELRAAFVAYNAERERCAPEQRSSPQAALAAATLYAEILRVHPFDDGNLRAAFAALQGALVSLGAHAIDFQAAMAEHDEALGWALHTDTERRDVRPFAELLVARMQRNLDLGDEA